MAAVKEKALGKLYWGGGYKGKLWAMVDPQGKEAKSGSPIAALARLNKDGRDAHRIIEELQDQRADCQGRIKNIQAENKRVAGKCAMVAKALNDASLLQNTYLQGYTEALRNADLARGEIKTASEEIEARLKALENAKTEYEKFKVDEMAEDKKKQFKDAKRDRDATIASITKVLAFAKLVRGGNLVAIADAAINKIATDIVQVDYEPKLKALKREIAVLGKQSKELDKVIVKGKVNEAALWLKAELSDFDNKQKSLNSALKTAAEKRTLAMRALSLKDGSTRATRGLADLMRERKNHTKYVEWARSDFADYKTKLERMMRDLNTLSRFYGSVDSVLKKAAKKDKSYSPDSEYGKAIIKWAARNGLLFINWGNYARGEIRYCKKEEKYVNDEGAKGPFAEFNKIKRMIEDTRDKDRTELRKYNLKCSA